MQIQTECTEVLEHVAQSLEVGVPGIAVRQQFDQSIHNLAGFKRDTGLQRDDQIK